MRVFVAVLSALAAVASVPTALARMHFQSPPEFTGLVAPSRNPVHVIGTPLELRWTPAREGKRLSVMLYQLNAAQAASFNGQFRAASGPEPGEYITHDQIGATSFTWFVGTAKDLSVSHMFAIGVWEEGTLVTDSATNIFNITSAQVDASSSTTSSSSIATSIATWTAISTSFSPPSIAPSNGEVRPTIESNPPAADRSTDEGMSTGAKVGVGIAVAFAVMLLVGLAWYLGRRGAMRRQEMTEAAVMPGPMEHYVQPDGYYYAGPVNDLGKGSGLVEAPDASPGNRRYELSSDREHGISVRH